MAIDVTCPRCGRPFRVRDNLAGKRFRCGDCGRTVDVPTARRRRQPERARSPEPPPPAQSDRLPRRRENTQRNESPRRRRRSSSSFDVGAVVSRLFLWVLIGVCVATGGYFGWRAFEDGSVNLSWVGVVFIMLGHAWGLKIAWSNEEFVWINYLLFHMLFKPDAYLFPLLLNVLGFVLVGVHVSGLE